MNSAIEQMLKSYHVENIYDRKNAMKEIMQEIVLCGLSRAGFFKKAAFYGGTALRIFYGLDRFSEDLDFSLEAEDLDFDLTAYFPMLEKEVKAFGLNVEIQEKEKTKESTIRSAFLKGNTKEHLLLFYADEKVAGSVAKNEAVKIKFEVDVNPPAFASFEHKYRLLPVPYEVKMYDNHIYWNSTALDCTRKFKNFIGSYRAVRRLSDLICAEHRLSVVENPQKHGLSYNKWRGGHDKLSNRDLLRMAIDAALEKQPQDFDALLALLKDSGYSVARKGRLSLRHENQKQSIRLESLGEGYSEQELRTVLAGGRTHKPFVKKKYPKRRERATLIADIEAKLNSGKGYRYDQAMKVVKLKQMAKTLIYLEENGFADFDALADAAADAEKRFYDLKATIKAAEARMSEIQTLRTHIMNYSRTRSVYTGYRKAGYSKKYLAEHEGDILIHKAAKKAFDAFGLKKLPTVRSLNEEFARLLAEKKAAYAEYHRAQEQMRELLIHKANAAYLLGLNEQNRQTTERQREEK